MTTENEKPEGRLALQILAMPADTNVNGDIFGGWLVSQMDMAAGMDARHRTGSRPVTVAINNLTFIKPVNIGDTVSCYSDLLQIGRTSMQFKIEVWTLSLKNDEFKKVAQGIFTFVAIDEQGNPTPVTLRPASKP